MSEERISVLKLLKDRYFIVVLCNVIPEINKQIRRRVGGQLCLTCRGHSSPADNICSIICTACLLGYLGVAQF